MNAFLPRPKRSAGMAGVLARKARRAHTGTGLPHTRRAGGRRSLLRTAASPDGTAWADALRSQAATLAHWMSTARGRPASLAAGDFTASVFSSV